MVNDQFGSPTLAEDLPAASLAIIAQAKQQKLPAAAVYHATGGGSTNWADFARAVFRLRGKAVTVNGIPSEQYPTPAPRPAYSVLDNSKLKSTFGLALPDWQTALARVLR